MPRQGGGGCAVRRGERGKCRARRSGDVPRAGEEDEVDVPRAGEERRKCHTREEVDVPHAGKERGKDAGGFHRLRAEVSVWRRKRSRLIVALLTLISHQSCSNLSCAQRTSGEAEAEEWGSMQGRR